MILAVDIGNTNLHFGLFKDKELVGKFELSSATARSADEYFIIISSALPKDTAIEASVISSVVPSVTDPVRMALKKITGKDPLVVGPGVKTGFQIKIDSPSELGADIASNAAAVIDLYNSPAVFADFGTATVISAVDCNLALSAVAIIPGIRMSLDALSDTGLLPGVFSDRSIPLIPKNTQDSMRCGVIRGSAMSVKGFFDLFRKQLSLPQGTKLIVSGGFAEYVLPYLPKETEHITDLTLKGLIAIYYTSMSTKKR